MPSIKILGNVASDLWELTYNRGQTLVVSNKCTTSGETNEHQTQICYTSDDLLYVLKRIDQFCTWVMIGFISEMRRIFTSRYLNFSGTTLIGSTYI